MRPVLARLLLSLVTAALLAACSDAPAPAPLPDPPGPADQLRLNEAWLIGTHNAYWVDRGVASDLFSSARA